MKWWQSAAAVTGVAVGVFIAATVGFGRRSTSNHDDDLSQKLASIQKVHPHADGSCADVAATQPLVLLALGQSNAGNHGELMASPRKPVNIISEGKCTTALDPLPGAMGRGGSIWSHLPPTIDWPGQTKRPVVISILALDATRISDWTASQSPVRARLVQQIHELAALGLLPTAVLWQQGEADARAGIDKSEYLMQLKALQGIVRGAGASAPIMLGQSTICRSSGHAGVRQAIAELAREGAGFIAGADTDKLVGTRYRVDDCHFTVEGQIAAADLWLSAIRDGLRP